MRIAFWGAVAAAAAVILGAAGWGMLHAATPSALAVGRPAPPLAVRTFDGRSLSLAELRGHPVVVNFWASWCAPCRAEDPALQAAARDHAGSVNFLGVAIQDSDTAARAFAAADPHPYPLGVAVSGSPARFGVTAPPETVFIDAAGVLVARYAGPLDAGILARYLQLAGA